MFDDIAILGPGLLGASLAMAVKAGRPQTRVRVWSRRPESRVEAETQPWCDAVFPTPEEAVTGAGLTVICSPVEVIVPLVERVAEALPEGSIVTDVGSTKSLVCRHGWAALQGRAHFVGSHPMAGSEKTGMANATAKLFDDRCCFITPLEQNPEAVTEQVVRFWKELGMQVVTTTPENHDEIVANISHLPHILASVLCSMLADRPDGWRNYSGAGLADTTRVAAGDPGMWKQIIRQNREEVLRAITSFEEELHRMKAAVSNGDHFEVSNILERGKAYRLRLPVRDSSVT